VKLQSLAATFEFVIASQRCGLRSLPFRFGCRSSGAATMEVVKRAAVVGRRRIREAIVGSFADFERRMDWLVVRRAAYDVYGNAVQGVMHDAQLSYPCTC